MKLHASAFVIALITVGIFASCKKGDIGPQGPQGPQGEQGVPGVPNVIYSEWFTASPWKKDTVFGV